MYVLACPCIQEPALRPPGITEETLLNAFSSARERCRAFGIDFVPLPCPETTYLGKERAPTTFREGLDTPAFKKVLDDAEEQVHAVLRVHGNPLCILGVDSSPSCGVNFTHYGPVEGRPSRRPGRGVFLSRFPDIPAMDVREFGRFRVYLAGPLFSEAERAWNTALRDILVQHFFEVFLPQEQGNDSLAGRGSGTMEQIYAMNLRALDASHLVVAVCDGADADSGTAWEMGYGHARGKPVYAVRTDFRNVGEYEQVNLMLEHSAVFVDTLQDLPRILRSPQLL
ncbi:MAG: nucleoside 2-deoxyribosyltransferase [Methanomicrobiales archaeon]|nr:nucleoside 2-deoxyribosyltransferase [Methanomicrobiales archaeon]